jgi:clan AA aspartic protease
MGLVYADLELSNPARADLRPMTVAALVDSGSTWMIVPQHVANQLSLGTAEQKEVTPADGAKRLVDYVGPLRVRFANRNAFVGAIVMGDEVLLGAIPMEDMDVLVHPQSRSLVPNPANPNIPASLAKGVRPAGKDDR